MAWMFGLESPSSSRGKLVMAVVIVVVLAGTAWLAAGSAGDADVASASFVAPGVSAEDAIAAGTRGPETLDGAGPSVPVIDDVVHAQTKRTPEATTDEHEARGATDALVAPDAPPAPRKEKRVAGSIRGLLLREGGPWTDETLPKPNTVMLDLASPENPRESLRAVIEAKPDGKGNYELAFEFKDVLEGDYELTLSALGSWRWAPRVLRVSPPTSGLVFTRYDKDPRLPLEFDVTDARTGDKITDFQTRNVQMTPSEENGLFLQTGPLDVNAFPIDGRFSWSLWADGYAPAFGDDSAFVRKGDKRVATVQLNRGWSTQVLALARDPRARAVRGARVLVDGRVVGTTGADGICVVRTNEAPKSLAVELAGWRMVSDPLQPYEGKTPAQRGQVTIVMLEKK